MEPHSRLGREVIFSATLVETVRAAELLQRGHLFNERRARELMVGSGLRVRSSRPKRGGREFLLLSFWGLQRCWILEAVASGLGLFYPFCPEQKARWPRGPHAWPPLRPLDPGQASERPARSRDSEVESALRWSRAKGCSGAASERSLGGRREQSDLALIRRPKKPFRSWPSPERGILFFLSLSDAAKAIVQALWFWHSRARESSMREART